MPRAYKLSLSMPVKGQKLCSSMKWLKATSWPQNLLPIVYINLGFIIFISNVCNKALQFYWIAMNLPAAPAWTLKGKKCTIDELNGGHIDSSPGPVYNLSGSGIKMTSLSFTTGKSQRSEINHGVLNNPSPSHYKPSNPALTSHSITIPKDSKYPEKQEQGNPDPAAYQFNPNIVKQAYPNYSMGSKYPSIMDDTGNNPGPGFYNNPELLLASQMSKNSRFGTQPRFSQPNLRIPGPGDYNISSGFLTNKGKLSQSRRSVDLKTTPGPGDYKHSDQFERNLAKNLGKTLSKKFDGCFNTQSDTVEAYNNYFKDDSNRPGKSFTVGKQNREVFQGNDLPGPTDYIPNSNHVFKDGTRVGFAKSSWIDHNELIHNPGPGHYKDQEFDSTRYTIPKSKSMDHFNKNPGAGRYDIEKGMGTKFQKYKRQVSGNLIGKAHRTNFVSKNIAGVGDYTLLANKTGGVTIPKANRFPKPNNNPGPGDYHMTSTISNFNMYRKKI